MFPIATKFAVCKSSVYLDMKCTKKIAPNFEGKYAALDEKSIMSREALKLGREIKSIPGVSSILRTVVAGVRRCNSDAFISIADRSAGGGGVLLAFTSDVWSLNVTKLEDDRPLLVPRECRS